MTTPPLFYCITHKTPNWALPSFMTVVGTGDYVPERGIAMSVDCPQFAHKHVQLGEYAALFMIRRLLEGAHATGMVGICHYRRYALTAEIGELRGFNFLAHPSLFLQLGPEAFHAGDTPVISVPVTFPGTVLQQYAANAVGRDILMFFGDAIDCGVITNEEAANFLSGTALITAGNVGVIPVEWFMSIMSDIEKVVARYAHNHYVRREGYDERSTGFCVERLHSLLLARKVLEYGQERVIMRPLTVLTETGRL